MTVGMTASSQNSPGNGSSSTKSRRDTTLKIPASGPGVCHRARSPNSLPDQNTYKRFKTMPNFTKHFTTGAAVGGAANLIWQIASIYDSPNPPKNFWELLDRINFGRVAAYAAI